ncbi:MAG: hypothetical protein RLZZ303_806 [Candidatus Hydrogenedentota bacterium]
MRQVQTTAPTREEAIAKALAELGVEMYEVDDIKILDEGSRGLFGLGARPVKVQVTVAKDHERPNRNEPRGGQRERSNEPRREEKEKRETRDEQKPRENRERDNRERGGRNNRDKREERPKQQGERPAQPAAREKDTKERGPRPERDDRRPGNRDRNERNRGDQQRPPREERAPRAERPAREERPPKPAPTEDKAAFAQISDEQGAQAAALLSTIIEHMGIEAEVAFKRDGENGARLEVKSPHGALLIGRKGATLGAMQYLINRMISQSDDGESLERVVVDVEGYLDRRRESLQDLARDMAAKAIDSGRSVRLKPMSPQERRIIHVTLQEDDRVRTYSQGEALYRSVVISPAGEGAVAIKGPSGGSSQGNAPRSGGGRGGSRSNRRVRPRPKRNDRDTEVDAGAFGD